MTAQAFRRLFFALWPDETIQRQLAKVARQLARDSQGKPIPWHNIHTTLAFLGDVADDAVSELSKLAADRGDFSCELVLDRVASFSRGVVYAAPTESPRELLEVAADLKRTLRERGFAIDLRPFVPHITLVRNARRSAKWTSIGPVTWTVRGVRLVQSELQSSGAIYHLVG